MSLKAKFIKEAILGDSRWEVYNFGKLVLKMTVGEITVGTKAKYEDIATVEFGKFLLQEIRKDNDDI